MAMVMTQTVEIFIVPQALKEPAATATVIVKGVCLIILYASSTRRGIFHFYFLFCSGAGGETFTIPFH